MNDRTSPPATSAGHTRAAGDGLSDSDMIKQVATQTSPDLVVKPIFQRGANGTMTDHPARQVSGRDLRG